MVRLIVFNIDTSSCKIGWSLPYHYQTQLNLLGYCILCESESLYLIRSMHDLNLLIPHTFYHITITSRKFLYFMLIFIKPSSRLWIGFPGVRNLYVDTKTHFYVIWKQSCSTLLCSGGFWILSSSGKRTRFNLGDFKYVAQVGFDTPKWCFYVHCKPSRDVKLWHFH